MKYDLLLKRTLTIGGAVICSILLYCFAMNNIYSDDVHSSIPTVELKGEPNPNAGYLNLTITNKSDHPIAILPRLNVFYSDSVLDAALMLFNPSSTNTIQVSLLFIGPVRQIPVLSGEVGFDPGPIEIAPGQKRIVKVSEKDGFIASSKGFAKARVYIFFNNKPINMISMVSLRDEWKQK